MRVGLECDETIFFQVVDDPLNILAAGAEIPCKPRQGLRAFRVDDGAEDLSAGAGEPSAATSRSPEVKTLSLSLNKSRIRLVKALPAGVCMILRICHRRFILTL